MRSLVLVAILSLPALAHAADYASPGVQLDIRADGVTNLIVAVTASAEGGHVNIPVGAVFSAGGTAFQDVVVSQALNMELKPGESVEVALVAYCMNRDRDSAPRGTPMTHSGVAPAQVTTLLERAPMTRSPLSRDPSLPPVSGEWSRYLELRLGRSDATQEAVWRALGQDAKDR